MKKTVSILLIFCSLLLASCSSDVGQLPDNLISVESVADNGPSYTVDSNKTNEALLHTYRAAVMSNASKLIESTAPELEDISSFSELIDLVNKYKSENQNKGSTGYESRKSSFVVIKGEIKNTDIVNVTITQYDSAEKDNASDLDVLTYNIDLSKNDSDIGKAIIDNKKEIGGKVSVDNCRLPDGKTAKIVAEINYCIREATDNDLDLLIADVSNGKSYKEWLSDAEIASGVVNVIWDYLLTKVQFKGLNENEDYKNYFNLKFSNASEYYGLYADVSVPEEELKGVIESQIKKEIIIYYYKEQLLDEVDIPDAGKDGIIDSATEKAIIAYYGYTEKSFEKRYNEDIVNSTLEVDGLNYRLYKLYTDNVSQ